MYMTKDKIFDPLISIIVPVYNVEAYIRKCIESIIGQTYKNIEIILVDDGSTDASGKVCDEYAGKDGRIKVIHKKNMGIVSARKTGVVIATGDYVTYVDSDDWIDNIMYEELVKEITWYDADIVTSGLYREYPAAVVQEFDNLPEGVYKGNEIERTIFSKFMYTGDFYEAGINMHLYNKLYRRELVLNNQMKIDDIVRVGDDAALVYPCVMDAKKIVILHKCFYHYRIRNNSIMSIGYKRELLGFRKIYDIIRKKIEVVDGAENILLEQLNFLMLYMLLLKEPQLVIRISNGRVLPFRNVYINERLVLYGSGKFGSTLYRYLSEEQWCHIVLWTDREEDREKGVVPTAKLRELPQDSYDKIIIAVLVGSVMKEIRKELIELGIHKEKIAMIDIKDETIMFED